MMGVDVDGDRVVSDADVGGRNPAFERFTRKDRLLGPTFRNRTIPGWAEEEVSQNVLSSQHHTVSARSRLSDRRERRVVPATPGGRKSAWNRRDKHREWN